MKEVSVGLCGDPGQNEVLTKSNFLEHDVSVISLSTTSANSGQWQFSSGMYSIYRIRSNYPTYPYKHAQSSKIHSFQIIPRSIFIYFLINAHIVSILMNCLDFKDICCWYSFGWLLIIC